MNIADFAKDHPGFNAADAGNGEDDGA